jgi:integrase
MSTSEAVHKGPEGRKLSSRQEKGRHRGPQTHLETVTQWAERYREAVLDPERPREVASRCSLHLQRFSEFLVERYGHDRIASVVRRDVTAWQTSLSAEGLAPATVNSHMASLSGFVHWVLDRAPRTFVEGDPCRSIPNLALPPLEPRALTPAQVRSLKSVCDRLERFHERKGRRLQHREGGPGLNDHARPLRDRAIVYTLLSTGLRREELTRLNLDQLAPNEPEELRRTRVAKLSGVVGKGKTLRHVFLSLDARQAIADYLDKERPGDADDASEALFLSARSVASRRPGGRLSPRSINFMLEQIGRWHDAEQPDPARRISPLRPHDLRHTFAFALAESTGADPYELERRLGHRSQRYIARYTNPPEEVAAGYVESL